MLTSTLRNVGGSVMVAIPKPILDSLGLTANAKVDLQVEAGRLIIQPRSKPRYALADLLAECDADASDDDAWPEMERVGREIW